MELKTKEDLSAFYRGSIIQKAIDIELRMDIVIGRFLSSNNQERTIDTIGIFDITESIGFYAKNRALQFIVKKYFINFIKINSSFFDNIRELMEKRNLVAHRRPDISTNDFEKLSWSKTAKNSVQTGYFLINKDAHDEYSKLYVETYIMIIELENIVIIGGEDTDIKPS